MTMADLRTSVTDFRARMKREPQQADESNANENGTPTVFGHEEAGAESADGGARAHTGNDDAVGEAAYVFGDVIRKHFGEGWERDGFADTEKKAHGKQKCE